MPRFFVPDGAFDPATNTVTVMGEDARHIARSLRMAVGDTVTVCSYEGQAFFCRLSHIRDDAVTAEIVAPCPKTGESPVSIRLFMAYPKGDKLETVIQKAVELGASRITPFESEHCIKRPQKDKLDARLSRWNRIATEAAKQCGRSLLPTVDAPLTFGEMLREARQSALPLFCYEADGTVSLKEVLCTRGEVGSIAVIIGSEGGFSPKEAASAIAAGCVPVNLGPRILRCETAPAYALSALSYFYEL